MLQPAPELTTDRLQLVPLLSSPEHTTAMLRLWNSSGYRKFSIAPMILTEQDAHLQISRMLAPPDARYWMVTLASTGEVVGEMGYLGNPGMPGFGWTIAEAHWRKGYGHEAAQAALDWGFEHARLPLIEVWLHPGNLASRALAMKLGFERIRLAGRPMEQRPQTRLTEIWQLHPDSRLRHGSQDMELLNTVACPRLNPIQPQLDVRNLQQEIDFFTEKLGFMVGFSVEDHAVVQLGAAQIHLDVPLEATNDPAPSTLRLPITGLDSFVYALPDGTLTEPLRSMPWGLREAVIITPSGHRIVLTEGL
ncbi:MAG: hypothetical protein Alpg2KO_23790 [Alphaproteobacteria bacterium]